MFLWLKRLEKTYKLKYDLEYFVNQLHSKTLTK